MNCELCKTTLKKGAYAWKIRGERKVTCPDCNQTLEKRASKAAVEAAIDGKEYVSEFEQMGAVDPNSVGDASNGCAGCVGVLFLIVLGVIIWYMT